MSTREHSIATWCKRFQIDLWNLHDRMKAGELILYEKRGADEVNVTHSAMNKIKELPLKGSALCQLQVLPERPILIAG